MIDIKAAGHFTDIGVVHVQPIWETFPEIQASSPYKSSLRFALYTYITSHTNYYVVAQQNLPSE